MNRRHFLNNVMLGAAAQVIAPGLLRAEVPVSGAAAEFSRTIAREPWLAGWKTVGSEVLGPTAAVIEGKLPRELAGVLYRNGPAWFERAGFRYQHWFDGDGMMHAWRIGRGAVQHQARMIATNKFARERQAGRFLVPAVGTTVPDAASVRNNDDLNTANTAVIRLGGRLLALWEGGSAIELDPDSLRTRGPVTWREDLVAAPFSAHPLLERDGTLWNFGLLSFVSGSGVLIWRIDPHGRLAQVATVASDAPGYLHSFAMTERHLVFMFMPVGENDGGGAFFEHLRFAPEQPCRVAIVPKDALDTPRWFDTDFCAAYHFGAAYERRGEIVMTAVRHRDLEEFRSPMAGAMRGVRERNESRTDLVELRLDLTAGRARWEHYGIEDIEFPTFDIRSANTQPPRLYAPMNIKPNDAPYFNSIAGIDTDSGRLDVHRYGTEVIAEEHCFVPKPRSSRAGEGWLIGRLLDYRHARSGIAVLDAEHISDGPLAQAWVPYTAPLSFHGWFASGA